MPGLSGMEVLKKIKEDDPEAMVIVITGYATVESAVEAMKMGAYDFIPKPFTPDSLRVIVKRALDRRKLALENVLLRDELKAGFEPGVIIGQSKSMKEVEQLVQKVGPTDTTVLIYGESGTGKELVARAIHCYSGRTDKPFVAVDCGSLVENLFESELFGHVKGSFTGATATKYGRFELANGGTLFFDEIGNLSINTQTKLLRVLQEREITKVGGSQVIKVDVRIVAATNKDLQKAVKAGTFRDDLFYRLSVVPITLPALCERRDDIPLLANYFLQKYNKKRKKNIRAISDRAMKALVEYDWPGNVRELENAIERAVVLAEDDVINPSELLYYGLSVETPSRSDAGKSQRLVDVEKEHIAKTLKMLNGHRGKMAERLGIDRKTLRLKLKKYGIE
jgi:DNA-binding NtrC family response regulator